MKPLGEIINERFDKVRGTPAAVNTIIEYCESTLADLRSFVAKAGNTQDPFVDDTDFVVIPFSSSTRSSTLPQKVPCFGVSVANLADAMAHPNELVEVQMSDNSHTYVTGQDVVDAFEDTISNIQGEYSFLQYVTQQLEMKASEFAAYIKSRFNDVSGQVVDWFTNIIASASSPIEALRSYFNISNYEYEGSEDTYLRITDRNAYTGNPYIAATAKVGDTVVDAFKWVFKNLFNFKAQFRAIHKAATSVIKWMGGTVVERVGTVYTKASDAPVGIMDFPVLTVKWSSEAELKAAFQKVAGASAYCYAMDGYSHRRSTAFTEEQWAIIWHSMQRLVEKTIDGRQVAFVTETIVGSYEDVPQMSIRVGKTTDGDYVMQWFVCSDYFSWTAYSDVDIQPRIVAAVVQAIIEIGSVIPAWLMRENNQGAFLQIYNHMDAFFDMTKIGVSSNSLAEAIRHTNKSLAQLCNGSTYVDVVSVVCASILYACTVATGFTDTMDSDVTDEMFTDWITVDAGYVDQDQATVAIQDYGEDFNVLVINDTVYKPYSKTRLLPVTIHYQTTSEQATDILASMLWIGFCVGMLYLAGKFLQWRLNARRNYHILNAAADQKAWQYVADPSAENLAAYQAAYSKAKNFNIISSLLGYSGAASSSLSSGTLLSGIATQGKLALDQRDQSGLTDAKIDQVYIKIVGASN